MSKVPLIVKTFIDQDDQQKLEIWRNNEKVVVDPPFSPYLMSKRRLQFDIVDGFEEEKVRVKLLSDLKEHDVWKYSFPNVSYIQEINRSLNRPGLDRHQKIVRAVFENHVPFITRILVDEPDFFDAYVNTDDLIFFFFDIETLVENHVDKKTITSIAYSSNDRKVKSKQGDEKAILEWFLDEIQKTDPDVLVGYYMRDFDLVRIIERCKVHGLDYTRLARDGSVDYFKSDRDRSVTMTIGGRVLYDILDSVRQDQTMHGIKDHKMKTVTKWFKIEQEDWTILKTFDSTVDTDLLKKYNEDDVRRTYKLFDVYWRNLTTLAEMFKVPLNIAVENPQTMFATIFMGRGLYHRGIMSDGMNRDRHPEIFNRQRRGKEDTSNYEAAMVGIYQPGFHEKVYKIDFSGMYPSIMAAFNLSPDVCKVIGYKEYDSNFRVETKGNKTIYHIPDSVLGKTVVIGAKNDEDGFLREELRSIREKRNIIKKKAKSCKGDEKSILESQQWVLKIMQNIPSGANGQSSFRWGDIGVTIPTVGIARELLEELKQHLDRESPVVIEVDTDGLYLSEKPDMEKINLFLNDLIAEKFKLKDSSEIFLDLDEYQSGYFIKMKNYVLMDLEGNLIFHGAGLKSSRSPQVFDMSRDILASALLSQEDNIKSTINKILNLDRYEIEDFTLRTTLHKPFESYSNGSLQKKIGNQGKICGIEPNPGTQYEYVKVKDGYRLVQFVNSIQEIDQDYYRKMIEKLIINMGLEMELRSRNVHSLDQWF